MKKEKDPDSSASSKASRDASWKKRLRIERKLFAARGELLRKITEPLPESAIDRPGAPITLVAATCPKWLPPTPTTPLPTIFVGPDLLVCRRPSGRRTGRKPVGRLKACPTK